MRAVVWSALAFVFVLALCGIIDLSTGAVLASIVLASAWLLRDALQRLEAAEHGRALDAFDAACKAYRVRNGMDDGSDAVRAAMWADVHSARTQAGERVGRGSVENSRKSRGVIKSTRGLN